MLGLVADKSKSNKKTIYIGHSMGTTSIFMLASRFPEKAQSLIGVVIALAPIVYLSGTFTLLSYPLIPIIVSHFFNFFIYYLYFLELFVFFQH